MGCGRTVGIVFRSRTSRAGGGIAWVNWCKSTARSTPGLRTADRPAHCWLSSMMRHRPLSPADDLDEILAWRVKRNLTLHYDRMMLLLDPTLLTRGLAGKKVEVVNYPDGRFAVQFNGTALG